MADDNQENNLEEQNSENTEQQKPEVQTEFSKVIANPKQSAIILIVVGLVGAILFYNLFFSSSKEDVNKEKPIPKIDKKDIRKPSQADVDDLPIVPKLPQAPEVSAPKPVMPEPPMPERDQEQKQAADPGLPALPTVSSDSDTSLPGATNSPATLPVFQNDDPEKTQRLKERRKSAIFLIQGVPKKSQEQIEQLQDFRKRSDLDLVLNKGKIIDAVLETAINTDIGGEVRAVIARDVYSEGGKVILIPKGSKIFGSYNTSVDMNYGRVNIAWNRIDLATGYVLNFGGIATDNLGMRGVAGRLDEKVKEKFTNVALTTALNVVFAKQLDKLVPPVSASSVTTQNQNLSNIIRNKASEVNATVTNATTANAGIDTLCAIIPGYLTNQSEYSQTVQTACTTAQAAGDKQNAFNTLYNAIVNIANQLLSTANKSNEQSKAQKAAEEGFKEFQQTLTEVVKQQDLQPVITIEQGKYIRISVNKDYKFPKDAVVTRSKVFR